MCIIIAKNKGIKMPTKEIISNCFHNNPDGAGIMLACDGIVYGFKGLMTLDDFNATLKRLKKRFGSLDELPVVMHFRISTHGSISASNTHPFPVTDKYNIMRTREWKAKLGMAHNGIITSCGFHPDVKKYDVSDTMVFISKVVHPITSKLNIMQDKKLLNMLQLAADSKLAFIDHKGNLEVLGNFTMDAGIYYSNDTYKAVKPKFSYSKGFGYSSGFQLSTLPYKSQYDYDWDYTPADDYSIEEVEELKEELAFDYGLEILYEPMEAHLTDDTVVELDDDYAYSPADDKIYFWDKYEMDWKPSAWNNNLGMVNQK